MKRMTFVFLFASVLCTACTREGGAEADHHEERGHLDEIVISPEAARLAGIRSGLAERRALLGGTAIPAEVQFEPSGTASIRPLVPGRLTSISVALGDRVRSGQVLGVVASSDVSTARARLGQTRARLAAAELNLERQRQLSLEGIGAQRALIEAEAQVRELRAEAEGARQQLSIFGTGSGGQLVLTSPIDGVVVDVAGTLGEIAIPEQATFTITDPSRVWVRGNVPELDLGRVRSGAAVLVRLNAFPELALAGTIAYVAPALDERTRSLPIRVTLEVPDPRLRSGLYGSIELLGGRADDRPLAVPVDAVATLGGQTVVFVPGDEPNSWRPQPVQLGRRAGGFVEVRAGLEEGTPMALGGAFTLKSALQSGELDEGHSH